MRFFWVNEEQCFPTKRQKCDPPCLLVPQLNDFNESTKGRGVSFSWRVKHYHPHTYFARDKVKYISSISLISVFYLTLSSLTLHRHFTFLILSQSLISLHLFPPTLSFNSHLISYLKSQKSSLSLRFPPSKLQNTPRTTILHSSISLIAYPSIYLWIRFHSHTSLPLSSSSFSSPQPPSSLIFITLPPSRADFTFVFPIWEPILFRLLGCYSCQFITLEAWPYSTTLEKKTTYLKRSYSTVVINTRPPFHQSTRPWERRLTQPITTTCFRKRRKGLRYSTLYSTVLYLNSSSQSTRPLPPKHNHWSHSTTNKEENRILDLATQHILDLLSTVSPR